MNTPVHNINCTQEDPKYQTPPDHQKRPCRHSGYPAERAVIYPSKSYNLKLAVQKNEPNKTKTKRKTQTLDIHIVPPSSAPAIKFTQTNTLHVSTERPPDSRCNANRGYRNIPPEDRDPSTRTRSHRSQHEPWRQHQRNRA